MHGPFAPDGVFVLFDLPEEQTVYAYPSGAFGWLGTVCQGFRPELMTKDSSGAKLLASEAVLPHAHVSHYGHPCFGVDHYGCSLSPL